MEKRRETTMYGKEQLFWMTLAVLALIGWLAYELRNIGTGKVSYTVVVYIICLAGVLVWRYAVRYTYILTDHSLVIVSQFLGYSRQITVDFEKTESFSNHYVKSFFKKTKISRYIYRYSSADYRRTRIIAFQHNGKIHAILFKVSDEFIEDIRSMLPRKFLDLVPTK